MTADVSPAATRILIWAVLALGVASAAIVYRTDAPDEVEVAPRPAPAPSPSVPIVPPSSPVGSAPGERAVSAPERKLSRPEVAALVASLQEAPVRDHPQARAKVLETLKANRDLALSVLRDLRPADLPPRARESIEDAMRQLAE